jgi:hypothetical protein
VIDQLVRSLAAGSDLTAEEMLDVLLLAAIRSTPAGDDSLHPSRSFGPSPPDAPGTPGEEVGLPLWLVAAEDPSSTRPTTGAWPSGDAGPQPTDSLDEGASSDGMSARDDIPAARIGLRSSPPIPEAIALPRALRRFRHVRTPGHRLEVDVEATVTATADAGGRLVPVFARRLERSLDLALVADASPAMRIWDDALDELARLMAQTGAFRAVERWRLATAGATVTIQDTSGASHPPRRLIDPSGRRVVMIATTASEDHWYEHGPWDAITSWCAAMPTALLQVLPQRYWSGTALGDPYITTRARRPAAPNGQHEARLAWWAADPGGLPLPVVTLAPQALETWAEAAVAGTSWAPGITSTPPDAAYAPSASAAGPPDPRALVNDFLARASPGAERLARVLASATALTMPLMGVLQASVAPETGVAELAEVLASSMLATADGAAGQPLFRCRPGTREILQRGVTSFDEWDAYSAVSRYLDSRARLGGGLPALVPLPGGVAAIDPDDLPFAELHQALAVRLGLVPPAAVPEQAALGGPHQDREDEVPGRHEELPPAEPASGIQASLPRPPEEREKPQVRETQGQPVPAEEPSGRRRRRSPEPDLAIKPARLYGRERIRRFVADALGRTANRDMPTPPIMIVTGPAGYGKTSLLAGLADDHKGSSPTAWLDFAGNPDATPMQVMVAIANSMGIRGSGGSVRFPLLMMGISAITLDGDSMHSLADQLNARLRSGGPSGQASTPVAEDAARLLPFADGRALIPEGGAGSRLGDALWRRQLGERLDWYARNRVPGRSDHSAYGPLLALHDRWAKFQAAHDEEARRDVWRVLCRALLADLRTYAKATLWRGARTSNCLLLLDNADAPIGRAFLEELAEARRRTAEGPDPLLVVAAQETRPRLQPAAGVPQASADEDLSYREWASAARDREVPVSPWYPVQLTGLSLGHVRDVVASHVLRTSEKDAQFTYMVTGGHPCAVRELARMLAAIPDPLPPGFDLRALVNREAEDTLLDMVRPRNLRDADLDAMAVFGITLRPRLAPGNSALRSLGWAGVSELDVRDRFLDLMWAREDEGAFTIQPLYRWLLTRWLARDRDRWQVTHEAFLAHYRASQGQDLDAVLYHELALTTMSAPGSLHHVVRSLAREFERTDGPNNGQWNDLLAAVTTAPNRLVQADAEYQAPYVATMLPHDIWEVIQRLEGTWERGDDSGLLKTVARLVAARWLFNDPLFDPKRKAALPLAEGYRELARMTPGNAEVFYRQASKFRTIEREWEDSW